MFHQGTDRTHLTLEVPFAVSALALCYWQSLFSGALFYAVISDVAGLERTLKEASVGFHKDYFQ